ncbi:MAG: response regulator [Chitinophagaceae bacterium]|nr:response regulator [Chitinophagaceae bacterium]
MKKQILAIDDSKAIRFLLQTVLGKEYNVITVPDGYSAMYYLSHRQMPDLIIADPQLPDMENWELIQQLSSSGMYGDIPLIVLSGLDKNETEQKCLEFGIVKYFVKPFNPVDLMTAVSDLVKSRQLDKDLSAMAS